METRVEQKITIQSDGDRIDHDKALAEAIQVFVLYKEDSFLRFSSVLACFFFY